MNANNVMRFFGYLLYTFLVGLIILKGSQYEQQLKDLVAQTYKPLPYQIYLSVYPIVIGFLMGLPKLISNFFKNGIWRFDLIKFVAIGIPVLLVVTMPIVYFSPLYNYLKFLRLLFYYGLGSPIPHVVAGIVFGYLICSVLAKRDPT
jgi:hypothetical protein